MEASKCICAIFCVKPEMNDMSISLPQDDQTGNSWQRCYTGIH